MKRIIEILRQSLIKYINERTIYKYRPIYNDFVPKSVRTSADLLTYEDNIRKMNPYYTCFDGQTIYVRDDGNVYMLTDHANCRSMSSWKVIGTKIECEREKDLWMMKIGNDCTKDTLGSKMRNHLSPFYNALCAISHCKQDVKECGITKDTLLEYLFNSYEDMFNSYKELLIMSYNPILDETESID